MPEILSRQLIADYINDKRVTVKLYDTLESTNKTAKELATDGADEGLLVVARHQTAGRGRLGRSFYSPADTGLYFTLVLRPHLSPDDITLITAAAAVSVAEAIEAVTHLPTAIKWVNDIFANGKKVAGILCEAAFNGSGAVDHAVLGIGINLSAPKNGFPDDIKNVAGGLMLGADRTTACRIIAETVNRFLFYYKSLTATEFFEKYRERLMLKGKEIYFLSKGQRVNASLLDIDRKFRLKVINQKGEVEYLSTGEITIGSKQAGETNTPN